MICYRKFWVSFVCHSLTHQLPLHYSEYEFLCADCDNGIPATKGASFCVGSWGEINYDLCKATEHETHGEVNRCECLEGFTGPLCHMRPVEGTASLHLDHATGSCSTCYEDNPWTTWDINQGPEGTSSPCASMGKLFFENGSETFSREFGLHLNSTHFSVFVSNNGDNTSHNGSVIQAPLSSNGAAHQQQCCIPMLEPSSNDTLPSAQVRA